MNCPSRTEPVCDDGWNQNPNALNADATTRADLSHMANARLQRDHCIDAVDTPADTTAFPRSPPAAEDTVMGSEPIVGQSEVKSSGASPDAPVCDPRGIPSNARGYRGATVSGLSRKLAQVLLKYAKFIGPGFMVAVAYIDPGRHLYTSAPTISWTDTETIILGNYSTDVAAGASHQFKLLFIVLMSNIFAIFLQSLCIKLGSVTGMNLAENCKAHLPPWLNYVLYFFAESAIIATDIAEVNSVLPHQWYCSANQSRSLVPPLPSIFFFVSLWLRVALYPFLTSSLFSSSTSPRAPCALSGYLSILSFF